MPTPTTSVLPKPKSWDEFEDIVWDIYKREWRDPHAQRYGRSGQRQNGVDIYGQQNGSGSYIAVQCKRYEDGKLNHRGIEDEISKAERFSSAISEYIIATTESRDTKIQDSIQCLNEQRKSEGKFSIHVVFWDDLCDKLANPGNCNLLKKHYSEWKEIFNASDLDIDWYQISQIRLEKQQKLTTNFLTRSQGITHYLDPVYVPLGLEEHKELPRRQGDVAPDEESKLYREAKTTQTFEHQQFLDQVLRQKQSPKSQGQRIAIVGQPGAGKTTRLQHIAQWVTQELKQVVIWVSLSALEGKTLEEYLLKRWLKDGLEVANVSPEQENAFAEWFKASQVWLLLDGADEMFAGTHASPLEAIADQITGWIGQARIVLTCRQNLWDTYAHGVEMFDTYRTLDFSYPTQVEQFIENWFAQEEATRGQRLCTALQERGRERIQDLVKNPLLLTLLCLDWHIREGKLPETKAALYEQFMEDFYEWKKRELPTTHQQRQQLNAKLSELALEAIEQEANRFCLRHEFISQFMGEPEDEASLFCLALKLGWLNKVGVDASNPRRSIYAFLHPTFEEYFAALEIVEQFRKSTLSFQQLQDEIFGKYWQEETWYEVLPLICGMIDVQSSGKLIEFLMQMYPENGRQVSRQELWEKWDRGEDLYEEYPDTDDFLLKTIGGRNLFVAANCFGQIRDRHKIQEISSTLFERLTDINDYVQIYHNEGISLPDFHWSVDTYISIVETVAENWKGDQLSYTYLVSEAVHSGLQEFCIAAILNLSTYWSDFPCFVRDLIRVARDNPFDSMNDSFEDSYESIDYLDNPRQVAMKVLMKHYPTHPEVLSLLQDRAINDEDEQVRQWTAEQLRR
jgi:energy-coupling factor transporter ATP-binding protein EcfA2